MLTKLFKKLFLIKEIKSKLGVLHFRRWRLVSTPIFSVYIHNIYRADEDKYMHDHPWNYWAMILKGGYIEQVKNGFNTKLPGSFGFKKAENCHKIHHIIKPTTTLFITFRRRRDWGYHTENGWIQHTFYRQQKHN